MNHFINVCIPPPPTSVAAAAAGTPPSFVENYRFNQDGDKIIQVDPSVYHMLCVFFEETDTISDLKEKILSACKKSHSKDSTLKAIQALKSQKGSIMDDERVASECFETNSYVFVCRNAPRASRKRVTDSAQPEAKKVKVDEPTPEENNKENNKTSKSKEEKVEKVKKVLTKTPKAQKVEPKKAETEKKVKKKSAVVKEKVVASAPVTPTVKKSKATPTAKSASKKATPPPPPEEEEEEEEEGETDEEVVVGSTESADSDESGESDGEDSD